MRTLKTCAEVLDALGGTTAVADELEMSYRAVHNWRGYSAHIPPAYYPYMLRRLHKLNYTAAPALWGIYEKKRVAHG
jgi:hypothetical protein